MKKVKKIIYFLVFSLLLLVIAYFITNYLQEPKKLSSFTRPTLGGKFIKLSKGYVHYEFLKNNIIDAPTIIFIHGAGSGYYAWDKNVEVLAQNGYNVLRYDLYGRGYSDRPELVYDLDLFVNQLKELSDSLNINKSTLVTVSMGCSIATRYTNLYPQNVDKCVFFDPASINLGNPPKMITLPIISDLLFTFYWRPKAVKKQMQEFYNPQKVAEYELLTNDQMKYAGFKRAIKSTWIHTLSVDMKNEIQVLASKNIPCYFVWGKNDPLVPYQAAENYKKLVPKSKFFVINDAGHLSNYERPDSANQIMLYILKK